MSDLTVRVFKALRSKLFDKDCNPVEFKLRPKQNTQDDPFDEYIAELLEVGTEQDISCQKAPGPLITPDMVVVRSVAAAAAQPQQLRSDTNLAVGIEVKKLERGANGSIARATGLDYNSTPPCGTVRVYRDGAIAQDLRGFYLFVCLERTDTGLNRLTALVLCDGNALNADFDYYLAVVGQRNKEIGLGTYGDGANRNRPMVIFANPLGAPQLDHAVTLLHERADLADGNAGLNKVGQIRRTMSGKVQATFYCYRMEADAVEYFDDLDPFPVPKRRSEKTTGRGRFVLQL